jgi:aryl-alcohol dehydrogenase-like predicted oxidoreductase
MAQSYGIAILPWSPLAAGFLTGKYKKGELPSPAEGRLTDGTQWYIRHFKDEGFRVVEEVVNYSKQKGVSPSQFSLAWCVQQQGVTSPIIGPRTMEQLEDNLKALDVKITDEDRAFVDRIVPPGRVVIDYYEADFGPSKYRW